MPDIAKLTFGTRRRLFRLMLRDPKCRTSDAVRRILVFLLSFALVLPATAQGVRLHSDLVQGRAALRAGQPERAAELARRALAKDPADQDAALLLALSLEAAGRSEEAVATLATMASSGPGGTSTTLPDLAISALARLLPGALPDPLAPDLQAVLPGAGKSVTVGSVTFRVVAPEGVLPRSVSDPKYGWRFSRRAVVYVGSSRRYSIFYQQAGDRALALRVAELLGRLHGAAALIPSSAPLAEVRVWLPRAGRAGGEQFRDSIYLFAVQVPRSDSEWVREVSHELGHIVLPSFAHFDEPEPMENGYLGERLLPKWLLDLGERTVWDGRVALAHYLQTRAVPLRNRYLDAGPASALRLDRGPAGMDYAIGLVLALEAQHGPAFLARVFARMAGAGLESLLLAYREEVAQLRQYRIPPELLLARRSVTRGKRQGRLIFRRVAYRAFLPSGHWQITARGTGLQRLRLAVNDQPLPAGAGTSGDVVRFSLRTGVSRWHVLQLESTRPDAALTEIILTAALSKTPQG